MADTKLTALSTVGALAQTSLFYVVDSATSYKATVSQIPSNIIYRDEGTDINAAGEVSTIDFVGAGVSSAYSAGKVTVTISGGSVSDGDKGDVTVSGGGTTWTIDNDVVSNAKLANMANATVKGRVTSGTGDPEDLTLGAGLAVGSGALNLDLPSIPAYATIDPIDHYAVGHTGSVNADTPWSNFLLGGRNFMILEDDFNNVGDGFYSLISTVSGTSAAVTVTSGETSHPGVVNLAMGTTTTGRAAVHTNVTGIEPGAGKMKFIAMIKSSPALSDGTETYTVRSGLGDSVSAEFTDGVFIRYTHSVNSGKWEFVTRAGGTETATDTGVTYSVSTWYRVEIDVNAGSTSASCSINGSTPVTNTTNIPSGSGQTLGVVPLFVIKSAGTTIRSLNIDYFGFLHHFTTPR